MDPIEPITYVASTSASSSPLSGLSVGFDIFAVIGGMFGGGSDAGGSFSGGGILSFLGTLWTIYTVLAFIAAIIMLVLYVFASTRRHLYLGLMTQEIRDDEKLYDELYRGTPRNSRLKDVFNHSESDSPNDWKLAIIEADIILDETLKQRGYGGSSLGERLKSIQPQQMSTLNDAWEAHKIRNRIAHDGSDFVLTKRLVHETISRYQRVFEELGVS